MRFAARAAWLAAGLLVWQAAIAAGPQISPEDLAALLQRKAPLVVDVRTPAEFSDGHIAGAINIPHDEIASRWPALNAPADDEVIVYCGTGRRAGLAQQALETLGYMRTRILEGGFEAWKKAGLPVAKESGNAIPVDG
ncbi:MAG TPA: rhodanese-like domain-containing protein [Rhodanobacteraceae bacterium]|nr:rhodanese-like domain-containing protein [Rhodanobacteraceae bacterium]